MEDVKIVDLFFARSEDALQETEKKYGNYLKEIAYRLLHSREDTEEIVGDTYLAAWNSIPPQRPQTLKYYLAKITRNLSMNRLDYKTAQCRGGNHDILLSELEECLSDPKAQDQWEAKEIGMVLNRFLGTLPSSDCAIFLGRYFYGYTIEELSKKYSLPDHRIKYRLSKARKQLAHFLQKEGINL